MTLSQNLLLLQLEVPIDLLNRPREVRLQQSLLLLQVLVNLRLNQGILVLIVHYE